MFNNKGGKSSTTTVNIYGIEKQGKLTKAIRLIDIPGLGDTDGIKRDK
jgi:GTP-binding protein EngB required for normal cell division